MSQISCSMISAGVRALYRLQPHQLYSRRNVRPEVRARHMAWYIARQTTAKSLPEIGRYMGGYDHTTVRYACQKLERQVRTDIDLAAEAGVLTAYVDVVSDESLCSGPSVTIDGLDRLPDASRTTLIAACEAAAIHLQTPFERI